MLRKRKFLSQYVSPHNNEETLCYVSEDHVETVELNGRKVNHLCKCHHQLVEETDFDSVAEEYQLKILLDAGVQLKPSPLMPGTSIDELSFINNTLNNEQYETHIQNSEQ